jgi:hypothetical protein
MHKARDIIKVEVENMLGNEKEVKSGKSVQIILVAWEGGTEREAKRVKDKRRECV